MTLTHVKHEMPYVCEICGFRTSIHTEMIDHFYVSQNFFIN